MNNEKKIFLQILSCYENLKQVFMPKVPQKLKIWKKNSLFWNLKLHIFILIVNLDYRCQQIEECTLSTVDARRRSFLLRFLSCPSR